MQEPLQQLFLSLDPVIVYRAWLHGGASVELFWLAVVVTGRSEVATKLSTHLHAQWEVGNIIILL